MEVQVAETGPCSRALTVTVPAPFVDQHLEQVYGSAQQQVNLKGFRPGKVPRHLLQKRFGSEILAQAKEQLINQCLGEACRKEQLQPVGGVEVDGFAELAVKPGSALRFTARIDVRPTFSLVGETGIEVEGHEMAATEADVDNALKEIAFQKRSIQATDEAAQDGDFLKVDMVFRDSGDQVVHEKKNTQVNTRIPVHGADAEAFSAAMVGASKGDERKLAITFPETFEKAEVRNQPGTATLTVHQVLRVTPAPIDDAFAKGLEFDTVESLRADLTQRIGAEKARLAKLRQEEQCLVKLLETHAAFALPQSLIEEQKRAGLAAYAQRMHQGGVADAEIRQKMQEADAEARTEAERRVRLFFLVDAVATKHGISVSEDDLRAEVNQIAAANSNEQQTVTAAQVIEHLQKNNQIGELRLSVLERKTRIFLRENAKIVDKKAV